MYQPIADIDKWDNATKRYYKEKIEIFIKTVMAVSMKECISLNVNEDEGAVDFFIEMGFIKQADDLKFVKALIKGETYKEFIKCGTVVVRNRKIYDPYLIKLNESARMKLQRKEAESAKFRLVDLFCGAGGLSLGFIREGCSVVFANDIDDHCI